MTPVFCGFIFSGVHKSAGYGSTGYIDQVETFKHEIVVLQAI
jgi:hypothetical protein